MDSTIPNLDTWTTEELLGEVMRRSAGDRSALDRVQVTTMRAILDDCDQKGLHPNHWHATEAALD